MTLSWRGCVMELVLVSAFPLPHDSSPKGGYPKNHPGPWGGDQTAKFSARLCPSPEWAPFFYCFCCFWGSPLFSTSQAKSIVFCWGPNSRSPPTPKPQRSCWASKSTPPSTAAIAGARPSTARGSAWIKKRVCLFLLGSWCLCFFGLWF